LSNIEHYRLTGGSPFHGKSYNEILWKNKNCDIKFNFRDYGHKISDAGIDFHPTYLLNSDRLDEEVAGKGSKDEN